MVVSKVLKLKIAYFREMRTEISGGGSELKHVLQNPGAWTTIIALALGHSRGIMANMVLCVIPGQGNSKILNLVKSGSFDSPIFLYIPNDEKTSTGHLI